MTSVLHSGWPRLLARVALRLSFAVLGASAMAQTTITYFHNDIAGTPMMATNASGAVIWKESYLPYGQRQQLPNASAGNKLWFTGKPYDANTGLSYMGARYYMPLTGRFAGMDPKDLVPEQPHSFNRYAYANNNPNKYVDPDGKIAETVWDAFNLALGFQSLVDNARAGNWANAAIDLAGITLDAAATTVPGVPGGASTGIKAYREVAEPKGAARAFYASLSNLHHNERIARIRSKLAEVAKNNGWKKNSRLSRMNKRDVYDAPDGIKYSVDTRHGTFEKIDRHGNHMGEYNIDLESTRKPIDRSGGHNLRK
ncbi:hypothetical protein D5045_02085 [Verminephrobacter eiseniae]|uniref:RHS repeat domain-containing protein n=1 Tax=Verminephrobacter eiseniae TaxID=364317 RepID=UPI002238E35B|nr:RHS repeat-associated core domain-containing protein [Verminephrobacter eiseniae]MCW5259119.1 hypothetical protein [Verminephrobacter eiseniae]